MTTLTHRRAAFAREYVKDFNATAAAIRAGYAPNSAQEQSSRLLSFDIVRSEVLRLQNQAAAVANVTIDTILAECEEARALALKNNQASAMVSATGLKAKIAGLLIEKTEDQVAKERLGIERRETQTAAEMIKAAAISLGLPLSATPRDVLEASIHTRIQTPAAYRLLRMATLMEGDADAVQ